MVEIKFLREEFPNYKFVDLSNIYHRMKDVKHTEDVVIVVNRNPDNELFFLKSLDVKATFLLQKGDYVSLHRQYKKLLIDKWLNTKEYFCYICYENADYMAKCSECGEMICLPCKKEQINYTDCYLMGDRILIECGVCLTGIH
eukprot:Pompholyxophrys_punicea_v1_NODE_8_length_8388_cov_12.748020.p7 type:complete len:143 gc:universal NODE_8_length_8388_cov_12.748020:6312-6740(+)